MDTPATPAPPPKLLSIKDFTDLGYLQELNRQFLHPLGLALAVDVADDGIHTLVGVWDCRDDLEGIAFAAELANSAEAGAKAARVLGQSIIRKPARQAALGYVVQPLGDVPAPAPASALTPDEVATIAVRHFAEDAGRATRCEAAILEALAVMAARGAR